MEGGAKCFGLLSRALMLPRDHSPGSGLDLQEQAVVLGCSGAAVEPVPMVPHSGKQCYLH